MIYNNLSYTYNRRLNPLEKGDRHEDNAGLQAGTSYQRVCQTQRITQRKTK